MEPPTPQCVGREFVRQYYTLLNQAPLHLHRFYNAHSSFVHGGIDSATEAEVVSGQQDIHQKIVQLNFKDCHAKIRKVDSHKTLADGVVVQVSGELSNNGQPMRRFVQTFVLAPQSPKKYYVHNDIFRYQDEVFNDVEGTETTPLTNTTTEPLEDSAAIQKQIIAAVKPAAAAAVAAANQIPPPTAEKIPEPAAAVVQAAVMVPETFPMEPPPPHMNGGGGYTSPPVEASMMDVVDDEWKPATQVPVETNNQWKEPTAPQEWKDEEVMGEDEDVTEDDEEPALPPAAQEAPNSNEPMSWSSRVKLGGGAGKPPVAPTVSAPAAPAVAPAAGSGAAPPSKEGTPFNQQNNSQAQKPYRGQRGTSQGRQSVGTPGTAPVRQDRFNKDEDNMPGRNRMMGNNDHLQLFVGNLPHNCSEADLSDLFSKFGKVADIRINKKTNRDTNRGGSRPAQPVPNFGFVVFDDVSAVSAAMNAQPIQLYGNHRLNIEEKKTKVREGGMGGGNMYQNDRMQGGRGERGSQDNLRGAGHPGSGRGGGRGRGEFGGNRGRGGPPNDSRGGYRGGGGGTRQN